MVSPDERHGDAEESRAAGESIFIVVFVAKDVVDAANSGDDARKSERAQPNASDADSSVLGGVGLQSNSAQLISPARVEQVEPDSSGNNYGDWLSIAANLKNRIVRPLQTLSNILAAIREGDYSIRGRREPSRQ